MFFFCFHQILLLCVCVCVITLGSKQFHFYTWIMMKNNRPLATLFIRRDNFLIYSNISFQFYLRHWCEWARFRICFRHIRYVSSSVNVEWWIYASPFEKCKKKIRNALRKKANGKLSKDQMEVDEIMQMETFCVNEWTPNIETKCM